jgi:hypothetical protein
VFTYIYLSRNISNMLYSIIAAVIIIWQWSSDLQLPLNTIAIFICHKIEWDKTKCNTLSKLDGNDIYMVPLVQKNVTTILINLITNNLIYIQESAQDHACEWQVPSVLSAYPIPPSDQKNIFKNCPIWTSESVLLHSHVTIVFV